RAGSSMGLNDVSRRAACFLAIALTAGCRAQPQSIPAAPVPSAMTIQSPSRVVETIHSIRSSGRLAELDNSIVPAARRFQVPVILAVDQVLAANAALQSQSATHFGSALVMSLDLSEIGESYHVFSHTVSVVRETISGDNATVLIQAGERVPLIE